MRERTDLIGGSPAMAEVRRRIEVLGPGNLPVLLMGETGTGKEVVARRLHALSGRDPFVAVNAAAVSRELLESELFGHVKGAFSGAARDRVGLIESARGGTLFLDEIGDMASSLQAKLLRVLERHEVRPVGTNEPRAVDVRVIAATNRRLDRDEDRRRADFREDLYYRLAVSSILLPPLRARPEDIPPLAAYYSGEAGIAPEAVEVLQAHPWPGNVRQLKSAVVMAAVLARGEEIRVEHLPKELREEALLARAGQIADQAREGRRYPTLEDAEREHVRRTLGLFPESTQEELAALLGIDRKTLRRKRRKYGLEREVGGQEG